MNSIGVFVDDTFRLGSRVTLNLGLRYDHSTAGIRSYPVLDANGNETGADVGRARRRLHLEQRLAACRHRLEAERVGPDGRSRRTRAATTAES